MGGYNFQLFPTEILDFIVLYLDHDSLCSLACVSKRLHQIYQPWVWRRVVLDLRKQTSGYNAEDRSICHSVKADNHSMKIFLDHKWFYKQLEKKQLSRRIRSAIQEITINYHFALDFKKIHLTNQRFPNLRVVRLLATNGPTDAAIKSLRPLAKTCKHVDIEVNTLSSFHHLSNSFTKNIRSLHLVGNSDSFFIETAQPYVVNTWIESMLNLEELAINLSGLTVPLFHENAKHSTWLWKSTFDALKKLKSLSVNCRAAFDIFQASFLQPTTICLSLSLYEVPKRAQSFPYVSCLIFESDLLHDRNEPLGMKFPTGLSYLELHGNISMPSLEELLADSPNLISLTGTHHITMQELAIIAPMCPNIKNLHLGDLSVNNFDHQRLQNVASESDEFEFIDPSPNLIQSNQRDRRSRKNGHFSNTLSDVMTATLRFLSFGRHGRDDALEDVDEQSSDEERGDEDEIKSVEQFEHLRDEDIESNTEKQVKEKCDNEGIDVKNVFCADEDANKDQRELVQDVELDPSPAPSSGSDPKFEDGYDFLGFTALKVLESLKVLTALETLVVYFPYDFFTRPMYKQLLQTHPKLKKVYLLYRPDCVTSGDLRGIFRYVKPLKRGVPAGSIVYEVDITGFKEKRNNKKSEKVVEGPKNQPRSVIVDRKCLYCVSTGACSIDDFV